jgi:alpha-mannosidase
MREWESHFTREYGWPRYSEYHHALAPHDGSITHADRVRAAEALTQKLITVVGKRAGASLPPRKSFVRVEPKNLQVLAFRKKGGPGFEIRAVEVEGKQGPASIEVDVSTARACETNLLGKKIADVACKGGKLHFESKPWRVQTFEIV